MKGSGSNFNKKSDALNAFVSKSVTKQINALSAIGTMNNLVSNPLKEQKKKTSEGSRKSIPKSKRNLLTFSHNNCNKQPKKYVNVLRQRNERIE
jgi:hypothetical protein